MQLSNLPFRSEAIKEVSSPESLDEAIQIASPKTWLTMATLLLIIIATLGWGVLGTVRTRIQSDGLVIHHDARHIDIISHSEGYLAELLVRDGDQVVRGDIVARIENDTIKQRYMHAEKELREIQLEIEKLKRDRNTDIDESTGVAEEKRSHLMNSISSGEALMAILQERIRKLKTDSGDEYLRLRQQVLSVAHDLNRSRVELAQIDETHNENISIWRQRLVRADQRLVRQTSIVVDAAAAMDAAFSVRAFTDGKIVEVLAGVGTFLHPNTSIYRMTNQVSGLNAVAFFSSDAAELIEPGMQAQISPGIVGLKEFGSARGVVRDVSRFRLSSDALMALLGNRQLVERFSRFGAPLAVKIDLVEESDEMHDGEESRTTPFVMESGMLVTVSIAIREQRPVTLVLPAFRWILGDDA